MRYNNTQATIYSRSLYFNCSPRRLVPFNDRQTHLFNLNDIKSAMLTCDCFNSTFFYLFLPLVLSHYIHSMLRYILLLRIYVMCYPTTIKASCTARVSFLHSIQVSLFSRAAKLFCAQPPHHHSAVYKSLSFTKTRNILSFTFGSSLGSRSAISCDKCALYIYFARELIFYLQYNDVIKNSNYCAHELLYYKISSKNYQPSESCANSYSKDHIKGKLYTCEKKGTLNGTHEQRRKRACYVMCSSNASVKHVLFSSMLEWHH